MSMSTKTRRFSFSAALVAALLSLGATAIPLTPAAAQGWAGVRVGPFGFGVATPYYGYPYYPPYPYYPSYYYPPNDYYPPY